MMMFFDSFYRKFGIRKAEQLLNPPLPPLEQLELPKRSVLHYVTSSPLQEGPAADEYLFRQINRPILMDHVTELGDLQGQPRKLAISIDAQIRRYHLQNRRYRIMRSIEAAVRDDNNLVVINYGFMGQLYRYPRSFYSEYYRWWNTQSAVWKKVAEVAALTDRHQFLTMQLPLILPSIADLRLGVQGVNQKMVKIFNTPESLMVLELWKWFGDQRMQSVMAHVPEAHLDRVNLVFQESGRWFVVNLGLLNKWRKAPKEELELNPLANDKGLEAEQVQRRFLRLLMSLMQVRTVAQVATVPEVVAELKADTKTEAVTKVIETPQAQKQTGEPVVLEPVKVMDDDTDHTDGPDDTADDVVKTVTIDEQIEMDLAELETISSAVVRDEPEAGEDDAPGVTTLAQPAAEPENDIVEAATLESGVMKVCDRLADRGMLSAAEYRRFTGMAGAYRKIVSPDKTTTLDKFIQINSADLKIQESPAIKDMAGVTDKSMLKSSLLAFDERYIKNVFPKDVAAMVLNMQNAGIAVTGYNVERIDGIMGAYDIYTVRIQPVEGAASTFRFKLPALEDDGTYKANGVKYRMRKQRGDLPIRKVAPDRVALTSYYGKIFASRSDKRVNNYGQWLRNAVMAKGLDDADQTVVNLHPAPVFDNKFECPRVYSILAQGFRGFTINPITANPDVGTVPFDLTFDHSKREQIFGKEAIAQYEKDGAIIVGLNAQGDYLVMDYDSSLYVPKDGNLMLMGTFEELLGLETEKAPTDFAELKVLGRTIPIGVILGYELGLEKLMKSLKVAPRRVPAGSRVNLAPHEYPIVFSDETLVFSKDDRLASMILAGFNEYHKIIRTFSVYEFDRRAVYLNVLESSGASTRYLREIDLLYQMFIDPITRDLLIEMKEPTDFRGLLMRSCEMLLSDQHPDEFDAAWMRVKGYERLAGAVYTELVRSIREHNGRPGKSRLPLDINPYSVWKAISEDPAKAQVKDINPIENLKQVEAVTYSGVGGRGSRSMTKHTRIYHPNEMGTISESTVDSGDVGINIHTSADPQFTSLRGISKRFVIGETGAAALLSTSALISPSCDRDDPKRVNFVGIQQAHTVACSGYTQMPVRTGYEQVIAHRTGDLFAMSAKKAGKVLSVSDTGIVVGYEDGEVKGFEIGRRYGSAEGLTIPHSVVTKMKPGQAFQAGDMICYNEGFFEPDILNPSNVVWKAGVIVKVALMESTATLEDSSAISARAAALLTTAVTKVKDVVVTFDQSVRKLVKVGEKVESENILCIIEDAITANNGLFDDESLDTLRVLSSQTPQAKATGVVERIEVFYHGDKEDMSESLQAIANASDRELARRNKAAGRKAFTGSVDDSFRVDGDPLALDTMVIRIYITSNVPAGVGDKGVFCNQMKTVFGEVLPEEVKTESGKIIDAIFGQKSISDRIVLSPEIIGTTTTLLDVIGKKALAAYRNGL